MSYSSNEAFEALREMGEQELLNLGRFKALELVDGYDIVLHKDAGETPDPQNLASVREIVKNLGGQFRETGLVYDLSAPTVSLFVQYMAEEFRKTMGMGDDFEQLEYLCCVACDEPIIKGIEELSNTASELFDARAFQFAQQRVRKHLILYKKMVIESFLEDVTGMEVVVIPLF